LITYSVASNSGGLRTGHITVTGGGTVQLIVNQGTLLIGSLDSPDFRSNLARAATDRDESSWVSGTDVARVIPPQPAECTSDQGVTLSV